MMINAFVYLQNKSFSLSFSDMRFEDLPNELFDGIFCYLDLNCVYRSFWGLNQRLNGLLGLRKNLSLILEENHYQWIEIVARQIIRLKISSSQSIDLRRFTNLISLEFSRTTDDQLEQIRSDLLPNLTELIIHTPFHLSLPLDFIEEIFSNAFHHLKRVSLTRMNPFPLTFSSQSHSIRFLRLTCTDILLVPQILSICPNLTTLQVIFVGQNRYLPYPSFDHRLEEFLLEDCYHKLSFETLLHLIDSIPYVKTLSLICLSSQSFGQFIEYLVNHCQDLIEFNCEILEVPNDERIDLEMIQTMKECFQHLQCVEKDQDYRLFYTE